MTTLYIEYLAKDLNFQVKRKEVTRKNWNDAYDYLERWGRKALDNFHPDMIKEK